MLTMTNWQNFPANSGVEVTTWTYDPYRGWLTGKQYANGVGPTYTYTSAGRLQTRAWARNITTTYTYDTAGGLLSIGYSDTTPTITYTSDRLGRQTQIAVGTLGIGSRPVGTASQTYNHANQLLSESWSSGPLNALMVSNVYDSLMRRTNLSAFNASTQLTVATYQYDPASRLATVFSAGTSVAYSYLANSPLVSQIVFRQAATTRMTTTKQYDYLNRLASISSVPSGSPSLASFAYVYNSANQRIRTRQADGSYWLYIYDSLGQVISGHKFWPDESPVAGQQFDYGFDTIGNRTQALAGGDQSGGNQRLATYSANVLNQYSQRTVPGALDIMGLAFATNAVTVNGTTAYRKGEYFRDQISVANSSSPVWEGISVSAAGQTAVTGNQFVPQTPEVFGYDLDGNLTNDGRWTYSWDAENRLVQMVANTTTGPQQLIKFAYDWKGRRIHKQVWNNTGGTGTPALDVAYLYDGWNLLAELGTSASLIRSYVWGLDLTGSPQGAGGVGGLLEMSYYGSQSQTTNCFAAFDGNGNVAALINAADGTLAAQYEYGPFGEPMRATGPMARANPVRFSTKYQDDESDFLYYGYRYLSTSMGRWLSRDPARERGGLNMYAFANNDACTHIDKDGRITIKNTSSRNEFNASHCGAWHFEFDYDLDNLPAVEGYIVQKVQVTKHWYDCGPLGLL